MNFDSSPRTTSDAEHRATSPRGYGGSSMKSIEGLWRNSELCDVVIIAGTKRIPAHRLILSIGCKYFHDMFTLNVREANQREITIEGVDGQAMENLINSMYTGKLPLNESNVENLISAADMMCMDNILKLAMPYLAEQLHPSNCLGIRDFAIAHSSGSLTDKAHRYTMNHFEEVVTHEEFLRLPLTQVCRTFDDNRNPYVGSREVTLLKAALTWLTNGDEDRKQHAPELLSCMKLNAIQQEMLSEVLQANPFLRDNEKCRQIFEAASQDPVMAISRRRPMPKISIKINQAARLWWSFYCLHPNRAIAELRDKLCVETCDEEHRELCYSKLLFLIDALATETELVVKNHWDCTYYQVSRIVNLLNRNFIHVSDQSQQSAIKCFAKWTDRGLPLQDCKEFLSVILKCATRSGFLEIVAECMTKVCGRSSFTLCISSTAFRLDLIQAIVSFRSMLRKWTNDKNVGSISGLTNWACAFVRATYCGTQQPLSIENFPLFDLIINLTVLPLQYPLEETSTEICFEFWWDLLSRLPPLNFRGQPFDRLSTMCRNVLWALLLKGRFPVDGSYPNWSETSKKLHRTYRSQSFKLACVISRKVGPERTFTYLLGQFNEAVEDRKRPHVWYLSELWLFGICAVCYSHNNHNFPQLPDLVDTLITVPTVSNVIGDTIFILVSILSSRSWLEEHPVLAERLFSKIWKHVRESKGDRCRTAVDALVHIANECFSVTGLEPTEYFNEVVDFMIQQPIELHSEADFRLLHSAILSLASLPDKEFFEFRTNLMKMFHQRVLEMMRAEPWLHDCNKVLLVIDILGNFEALCPEGRRTGRLRGVLSDAVLPIPKQLEETVSEISNHWMDCLNLCDLDCCSGAAEHPKSNSVCVLEDLIENGKWPQGWSVMAGIGSVQRVLDNIVI